MADPRSPDLTPAPGLELWLSRHHRRVAAAVLACAVAARLLLCLQLAGGPLPRFHQLAVETDNAFFHAWAEHLAGGDWLQRGPLHPTYAWMRDLADRALVIDPGLPERMGIPAADRADRAALQARLWDGWMGGATFYQEPAYPYLVGLTYLLTGPDPWHVFAWQLLLGVTAILLLHQLARRLWSETAALATAALALLCPIPLVYEVSLLRDSLVVFTTVALALLMAWAPGGGRRRWLGLGLAFGAAALVKQSFLFFPLSMAAWRLVGRRAPLRDQVQAAGLVAAGMGLALVPVVARNLAVGVGPLSMNGSALGMLAVYHARSASPVDLVVGPEYAGVLAASHGGLLSTLLAAARTHPDPWGFASLNLQKLLWAWHPFEAPNNVDPYLFRQAAPLLWFLPATVALLVPLGGVGLASRRAWAAWPVLVAVAATLPGLVLAAALSRYRAPLAVMLVPLAGAGAARLTGWVTGRRWGRLGAFAGATALYLAWAMTSPPGQAPAERARKYAWTGVASLQLRQPGFALLCLREASRLQPADPKIRARLGQALLEVGDGAGALAEVELAMRSFDSAPLRELHARALAHQGRAAEATAAARAALALDPANQGAGQLLQLLQPGDAGGSAPPPAARREPPP